MAQTDEKHEILGAVPAWPERSRSSPGPSSATSRSRRAATGSRSGAGSGATRSRSPAASRSSCCSSRRSSARRSPRTSSGHGPNDQFYTALTPLGAPIGPFSHVSERARRNDVPASSAPTARSAATSSCGSSTAPASRSRWPCSRRSARSRSASLLGSMAGYFRGWVDTIVSRVTEITMAFPALLFIIALASTVGDSINNITFGGLIGPGVFTLFVVFSVFGWFYPARIIRAVVLSLREKEFIEAARMVGSSDWRIIRSHILPHLVAPIIVYSTLSVAELHPRRGGSLVPRRRDQAADRELGQPPRRRARLLHRAAVADGLAGPRRADHDAGVQPARRRPPRRVRPARHPLAPRSIRAPRTSCLRAGNRRFPYRDRRLLMRPVDRPVHLGFAVNEELTKLPPPRHS